MAEPSGGRQELSRAQMMAYLKHKAEVEQTSGKPLVATELYDMDNLSLVTENPPHMIMVKVRLRLIIAACDPKRQKSLLELFIQYYNEEMVAYKRQGRQEYLGALQAMASGNMSEQGEPSVNLR